MSLGTTLQILSSVLMIAAFNMSSILLMLAGTMLTGFSYGGMPPTSAAFTADFFGASNFPLKFGIVCLYISIGAFGSALAGFIKDRAGSFQNLFYILIAFGVIAMILNLLIQKKEAKNV